MTGSVLVLITGAIALSRALTISTPFGSAKNIAVTRRSCGVMSFMKQTDLTLSSISSTSIVSSKKLHEFCHRIDFPDAPTTILYNRRNNLGCWYKVVGYFGSNCEQDTLVSALPWNSWQPKARFNERNSVCSLMLQQDPETWVTVKFMPINGQPISLRLSKSGCYNLCGEQATYYPRAVTVFERDGDKIAHHDPIVLFSKLNCDDDSKIVDAYGQFAVTNVTNLAALTLVSPKVQVHSFKIIAMEKTVVVRSNSRKNMTVKILGLFFS